MKFKILLLVSILMIFSASSLFANPVIFSQPYDPNSSNAFSSVNWDGDDYFQGYADYFYDNATIMTDFHWWGAYDQGAPTSFEINIYENAVGAYLPGTLAYSQTVAYGDANEESVGANAQYGFEVFKYSVDFTNPISGWDSGFYWISVMAYTESPASNWFWALGANNRWEEDLQYDHQSGGYTGNPGPDHGDFAFEITGERVPDVPEPATLTLFGLGLLGSALARRRRNKK